MIQADQWIDIKIIWDNMYNGLESEGRTPVEWQWAEEFSSRVRIEMWCKHCSNTSSLLIVMVNTFGTTSWKTKCLWLDHKFVTTSVMQNSFEMYMCIPCDLIEHLFLGEVGSFKCCNHLKTQLHLYSLYLFASLTLIDYLLRDGDNAKRCLLSLWKKKAFFCSLQFMYQQCGCQCI
jgi:hypothetical protein